MDRITDPGFNLWTSGSALANWAKYESGTSVVARSTDRIEGDYSASLVVDASDNAVYLSQDLKLVPGRKYRLTVRYKNSTTGKTAGLLFRDATYERYLKGDGSWSAGFNRIVLQNSTVWRTVTIEFAAYPTKPMGGTNYNVILVNYASASSTILFDYFSIAPADGCGFLTSNQFDSGTLTASSEATLFPKENVRHRWFQRPWRSTGVGSTQWLKLNRGATSPAIKALAVRKTNLTASATASIQGASSDLWTAPPLSAPLTVSQEIIAHLFDGAVVGEVLKDGGFEDWTSPTDLTQWEEYPSGTSTINREATVVHEGTYSVAFQIDSAGNGVYIQQYIMLVSGRKYRIRFWYKNSVMGKTAKWVLTNSMGNVSLTAAGAWTAGVTYVVLANATEWTQVEIEFYAHASYTNYILAFSTDSAASSTIYWDRASLAPAEWPWYEWWQLNFSDATNPDGFISVGRVYLGGVFEPSRSFLVGTGVPTREDPSLITASEYGQTSVLLRDHYRSIDLEFDGLNQVDYETIMAHFAEVGIAKDFFFIRNLADPWNETYYVRYALPPVFKKKYPDYYSASIHLVEIR